MYDLPTSLTIGGNSFGITNNGDFRTIADCFAALDDSEINKTERVLAALIIFYADLTDIPSVGAMFGDHVQEAVDKMFWFFNCGQKTAGMRMPYKLIDWEQDEQMIVSAVNAVAGKEIRLEPYIHWWTFMGYYTAIGRSVLSTVVGIRNKLARGKKLEKDEQEFRRENPQYFIWNSKTSEQREAEEYVKKIWNSGK